LGAIMAWSNHGPGPVLPFRGQLQRRSRPARRQAEKLSVPPDRDGTNRSPLGTIRPQTRPDGSNHACLALRIALPIPIKRRPQIALAATCLPHPPLHHLHGCFDDRATDFVFQAGRILNDSTETTLGFHESLEFFVCRPRGYLGRGGLEDINDEDLSWRLRESGVEFCLADSYCSACAPVPPTWPPYSATNSWRK
jgi:hypothetical protein